MVRSGSNGEACIGGNPGCSNAVIPRIGAGILGISLRGIVASSLTRDAVDYASQDGSGGR